MRARALNSSFFTRNTLEVAPDLLGKIIFRRVGKKIKAGRVTEVEAYRGEDDKACHASRGRTKRTEALYGPPATIYVFLIYGMYHCLNIVTEKKDYPAAVLIRACEPVNKEKISENSKPSKELLSMVGPGKLCKELKITRARNRRRLSIKNGLWLGEDKKSLEEVNIGTSPRIAVSYAGECTGLPWRFFIRGSKCVSQP